MTTLTRWTRHKGRRACLLLPCGGQIQKALALTLSNVLLRFLSTHIHGTSVPVEEPSTASKAAVSNRSKTRAYSITSSARPSRVGGTVYFSPSD